MRTGISTESFAIHAPTVGAIGGLTLCMMTRTARGHTARPLVADRFELAMFLLVQIAAVVRVFGGLASSGWCMASVQLSGLLWAAMFGLYAVRYWPVLTRSRLDEKRADRASDLLHGTKRAGTPCQLAPSNA